MSKKLKKTFSIGAEALVYRDGEDGIDWHADDTQGEDSVFCLVVESPPEPRCVYIKPTLPKKGDLEIKLFPIAGDGYCMNELMQKHFLHCVPKDKSCKSPRKAWVFRNGARRVVKKDKGCVVPSLEPPVRQKPYLFGALEDILKEGNLYPKKLLKKVGGHR